MPDYPLCVTCGGDAVCGDCLDAHALVFYPDECGDPGHDAVCHHCLEPPDDCVCDTCPAPSTRTRLDRV